MLKKCCSDYEYIFVLNNLRDEDKIELYALFGSKWYQQTIDNLKNKSFLVFYGKDFENNSVPIAIGGFHSINKGYPKIACVWLLTTIYIYKNKLSFFKMLKSQFKKNNKKYQIMYNFIYKSNYMAKSWLKKFGFKFDNPKPKNIQLPTNYEFFYKVNDKK